jgi:hypothetical protein
VYWAAFDYAVRGASIRLVDEGSTAVEAAQENRRDEDPRGRGFDSCYLDRPLLLCLQLDWVQRPVEPRLEVEQRPRLEQERVELQSVVLLDWAGLGEAQRNEEWQGNEPPLTADPVCSD